GAGDVAGEVRTRVAAAVDERVASLAVRRDGGSAHGAVFVAHVVRLLQHRGALRAGVGDAGVDVGYVEGQVDDAVAMLAMVVEQRARRVDSPGEHETSRPGTQHETLRLAVPRLGAAVGLELHAEGKLVEGC